MVTWVKLSSIGLGLSGKEFLLRQDEMLDRFPTRVVSSTMMGAITFGNMWCHRIRGAAAPMVVAAQARPCDAWAQPGGLRKQQRNRQRERAKARLELGSLQGLESASGKAEQLGFYETVLGDPAALFDKLGAYRRATAGDLLRVARRYLVDSARTIIEVHPDGTDELGDDGEEEEEEAAA